MVVLEAQVSLLRGWFGVMERKDDINTYNIIR